MKNLAGQEPWELRGANEGRLSSLEARARSLETSRTTDEATLAVLQAGAWTAYTPAFYGFVQGNGLLQGWYCRMGRTIHVNIRMQWGSTSSWADYGYLYVPFAPKNPSYWVGSVYANASGIHQVGVWRSDGSGGGSGPILFSNGSHINTGNPAAWAAGNVMWTSLTYEAAS